MARFSGVKSGEKLNVSKIIPRDGAVRPASGTCRISRRSDSKLTTIRCSAKTGRSWIVSNFASSRLYP
jgi:hypothetical protein